MITGALLNIVYYFIYAITSPLRLLGDVVLNSNFASSITTASGYYHSVNTILPIDSMITILGVSLTIELSYATFKVIMWVIKKIPTIN
jgi:hypothetical protein